MSRDQRMRDNWALLYALERAAATGAPCAVAFNLVPAFLGAGARQFVASRVAVPFAEVDAHNVVPVWVASDKREYAARTIRPKIHAKLPEFLVEFPAPPRPAPWGDGRPQPDPVDWEALLAEVRERGAAVPEVTWATPGEDGAAAALVGAPGSFLSPARLSLYAAKRNDPGEPQALSNLSPWLHFGQLAPQRAALEAAKLRPKHRDSVEGFLEELVVRRELADNYCHYCPATYDSLDAAYDWARDSLAAHAGDKREFIYTTEQLEAGRTHDELWNAAQREMVVRGKMHGFMRMYWAKKILEWTPSASEAVRVAIYLNDKYQLDGRDPNGYVGVMWSVAGIHDQGWGERPVFGKIRYMNYAGCKRKFDIPKYVAYTQREEAAAKRGQAGSSAAAAGGPPAVAPVFAAAAAAAAAAGKRGGKAAAEEGKAKKKAGAPKKA
ncbi:PHR1 [Scenedesmus sp. PABB004]|nr:PHR1 [Scenedesmus sp. PABB004]